MSNVHEYLREFESSYYDLYDYAEFLGLDSDTLTETLYYHDELFESYELEMDEDY